LKFLSTFISAKHGIFPDDDPDGAAASTRTPEQTKKQVKMYIVFSCIWGLCANIHEKSRKPLSDFMRPILKKHCPDVPDDLDLYQIVVDDTNVEFIRKELELRQIGVDDSNATVHFGHFIRSWKTSSMQSNLRGVADKKLLALRGTEYAEELLAFRRSLGAWPGGARLRGPERRPTTSHRARGAPNKLPVVTHQDHYVKKQRT